MFGPIRFDPKAQILFVSKRASGRSNLSIILFHSPPSAIRISSNFALNSATDKRFSSCTLSVVRSTSSSTLACRSRRKCFILSACFNRNSVTLLGNGRVRMRTVTSPFGEVIVAVPLLTDESFNATISTHQQHNLRVSVPGALTIVSRNGTIGLLAEISTFANLSRKSFKQRYHKSQRKKGGFGGTSKCNSPAVRMTCSPLSCNNT